jgi:nitroimidazol reductase NimA-like FMN-containing flavoprotein (pyridoxamine 5'-phosphate oxidase superfamily)
LKTDPSLEDRLQKLFRSQKLGVLATLAKKNPYTNLIAFACSDDLRQIVFATAKTTRKFENMLSNSSVSFFIDNRSNKAADFRKAMGVTAVSSVRQIRKKKQHDDEALPPETSATRFVPGFSVVCLFMH